jgi:serine/threonine-protein kinase
MPPGRVIYLLRQVCGALAEAHAAGLIHRDVKPANILACQRGGVFDIAKLLDFGLVKGFEMVSGDSVEADQGEVRSVRGTPLYMSPEQITRAPELDQRCDLYALGAVGYKLLTGNPPFPGSRSAEVLSAQLRDPVTPPRQFRPEIPEDLERVILRCLAKWPKSRFNDALALEQAFAACASAADWNTADAERWWRDYEPEVATSTIGLS